MTFPAVDLATGVGVSVADNSTSTFSATATSRRRTPLLLERPDLRRGLDPTRHADHRSAAGAVRFLRGQLHFTGSDGRTGIASFECSLDSAPGPDATHRSNYTGLVRRHTHFEVRAADAASNTTHHRPIRMGGRLHSPPSTADPPAARPPVIRQAGPVRTSGPQSKQATPSSLFRVTGAGSSRPARRRSRKSCRADRRAMPARPPGSRQLRLRQRSVKPASMSVARRRRSQGPDQADGDRQEPPSRRTQPQGPDQRQLRRAWTGRQLSGSSM